jgi:hypothetical protein
VSRVKSRSYSDNIPDDSKLSQTRDLLRSRMGNSNEVRNKAIKLTIASSEFQHRSQLDWSEVPIIRHRCEEVL